MAKIKTSFFCQHCGAQYAQWQGQCSSCKNWNTIVEEIVDKPGKKDWLSAELTTKKTVSRVLSISEIEVGSEPRLSTLV